MQTTTLGLPLEYSTLSAYFDVLGGDHHSTHARNHAIETILGTYKVKTVLDLTCGTGSQVFWLAQRGYTVTGADFSPALLAIARAKAQKENIAVTLLEGDMRSIQVGSFNSVITIHNAIGHLTKTDFEKTLQNIHRNLKDGGLYVFDIFNLATMTDTVVNDLAMDVSKTVDDTKIRHVQYSTIDKENGLLTSYDQFAIQKGSAEPQTFTGEFTLQLYTAQELRDMLARNGFETLGQYGFDGSPFLEHETTTILTVAQKV